MAAVGDYVLVRYVDVDQGMWYEGLLTGINAQRADECAVISGGDVHYAETLSMQDGLVEGLVWIGQRDQMPHGVDAANICYSREVPNQPVLPASCRVGGPTRQWTRPYARLGSSRCAGYHGLHEQRTTWTHSFGLCRICERCRCGRPSTCRRALFRGVCRGC